MSNPPSRPDGQAESSPQGSAGPQKFSAETLRKAEAELAQYIGPMAKVIVKRAAAKARFETELYMLIAEEIKDPAERRIFVRKATSLSDRR